MANIYNIPKTPQDTKNAGRLIIRTFGLGFLKEELYAYGMPRTLDQDSPKTNAELPQYKSMLGNYVFSDLDLDAEVAGIKRIQIPTVLFNVTQTKNIIRTSVQGKNGSVKEYISDGDYQINIKGIITGYNGIYPNAAINSNYTNDLLAVLQLNKSIKVNSWYLKMFGISELVVLDYQLPQVEGQYSTQPFEINAISDVPFEININS